MEIERKVATHYGSGELEQILDSALRNAGKNPDHLTTEDLAPLEDLHVGGRQATADLAAQLKLSPGIQFLDIGSGIGGTARFVALQYGCRVTGVDLTDKFVRLATNLTRRVGLDELVAFHQGSALDLSFPAETFDRAAMLHVGMNIADKDKLFKEAHRVLKPGGLFAVYDIMRLRDGDLQFPQPWAASPETSFMETPDDYRRKLHSAGFAIEAERNRLEFALDFFKAMQERAANSERPSLGPQIFMGENARERLDNAVLATQKRIMGPVEIIARRS